MKKLFPVMYDCPEKTMYIAGAIYCVIGFFTFPFLTLFFAQGYQDDVAISWFEIVYHVVNFLAVMWIFRTYLKDSFFNVRYNLKPFLIVSGCCAAAAIVYAMCVTFQGAVTTNPLNHFVAESALPLMEVELLILPSYLVNVNPIAGTIVTVFLAPVVISCLYYASTFAPACNSRPWLAYLVVMVMIAVPRIFNSLTFWDWKTEALLYAVQLPIHLIACYSYQKSDTVWAPIAVHMTANAVGCAGIFGLLYMYNQ